MPDQLRPILRWSFINERGDHGDAVGNPNRFESRQCIGAVEMTVADAQHFGEREKRHEQDDQLDGNAFETKRLHVRCTVGVNR